MRLPLVVALSGLLPFVLPPARAAATAEAWTTSDLRYSALTGPGRSVTFLETSPDIRLLWTFEAPFVPVRAAVAEDGSRVALLNALSGGLRDPRAPAILFLDRRGRMVASISFARLFGSERIVPVPDALPWFDGGEFDDGDGTIEVELRLPVDDWDACVAELDPEDRDLPYDCMSDDDPVVVLIDADTGGILSHAGSGDGGDEDMEGDDDEDE